MSNEKYYKYSTDELMAIAGLYGKDFSGKRVPNRKYRNMSYFIDLVFSRED